MRVALSLIVDRRGLLSIEIELQGTWLPTSAGGVEPSACRPSGCRSTSAGGLEVSCCIPSGCILLAAGRCDSAKSCRIFDIGVAILILQVQAFCIVELRASSPLSNC